MDGGHNTRDDLLADFLAQARRSCLLQKSAMENAINSYSLAAPADCGLALDIKHLGRPGTAKAAQNELYHRGWRLALLIAINVGDHLGAIADVAGDASQRVFAHMSMARAALEGAARLDYLLCPAGSVQDRVIRAAALLVASAENEVVATEEFVQSRVIGPEAVSQAQRRQDSIVGLIRRAGIEIQRTKRDQLWSVVWSGSHETILCSPNVTALLRELLPGKPGAYRVGSGAVHSQSWVLDDADAFDPRTRRLDVEFDPAGLASSVDLAIQASVICIKVFAKLLGHDSQREITNARRREQATSRMAWALLR